MREARGLSLETIKKTLAVRTTYPQQTVQQQTIIISLERGESVTCTEVARRPCRRSRLMLEMAMLT